MTMSPNAKLGILFCLFVIACGPRKRTSQRQKQREREREKKREKERGGLADRLTKQQTDRQTDTYETKRQIIPFNQTTTC